MKYYKIAVIVCVLMFDCLSVLAADNDGLIEFNELKNGLVSQDISGLDMDKSDGIEIITYLSRNTGLRKLFKASAGVWEGYSIEEHTLMVFDIFTEQLPLYQAHYHFNVLPDVRLLQTLKLAIVLHDIGKPYAVAAKNKSRQHEFTVPILEKVFLNLGFSDNEIKLAKALVGNDIMGALIKGDISAEKAKSKLTDAAQDAGMPLINYAPLQFLFYTIDAASYPSLRQRIMTATTGGMMITDRLQFQQLLRLINDQA